MKSLIKRIELIFSVLFLCVSIAAVPPIKAHAWEAHLDEDNNITFRTFDKKRSSDTYYKTIGVTITRCAYNPTTKAIHESKNYLISQLGNIEETLDPKTNTYYNTWTIKLEDVIKHAGELDPEWANEIQGAVDGTGPAVYIKLDCRMVGLDEVNKKIYGPFMNVPDYGKSDGNALVGVDKNGNSMAQIFDVNRGLTSHFNRYLLIGKGEEKEPEPLPDELVTYDYTMDHYAGIDANQPAYAMSNNSDLFDLSKGIPSSEYIDNAFLADSWYGNTNVYARKVGKEYTFNMTYVYTVDYGSNVWTDTNKNGVQDEGEVTWVPDPVAESEEHELPIGTAYCAFQFLADTHVYDFTNADIENGAYEGDHVYYDDTDEVPMTCISSKDYVDVAAHGTLMTEEPDWLADTGKHVEMADYSDIEYENVRFLEGIYYPDSLPDFATEVYNDTLAIRNQISQNTRTRNDKLVIDGITYMRNDWITGCDFFDEKPSTYRQCISSAAWKEDYCLQAGIRPLHETDPADVTRERSVQIPPTKGNGYYTTKMKVFYQRLISYSKTPASFEAD